MIKMDREEARKTFLVLVEKVFGGKYLLTDTLDNIKDAMPFGIELIYQNRAGVGIQKAEELLRIINGEFDE